MYSVFDVAKYILQKTGEIPAIKLQKLVYYSQAWSLVWDDKALFGETIEAWANGPVVRELYAHHRGQYSVTDAMFKYGNPEKLDAEARETIDSVLQTYGDKPSYWLSELTHMEDPWKNARQRVGLAMGERGNSEITHADMAEYYSSL